MRKASDLCLGLSTLKINGFTFVELMIASLIGAALSATALSLFLMSLKSDNRVSESVEIQRNGNAALMFVSNTVKLAGYSEVVTNEISRDILFPADEFFGEGQVLVVIDRGERLLARMYGSRMGIVLYCNGKPLPEGLSAPYIREITLRENPERPDEYDMVCLDLDSSFNVISQQVIGSSIARLLFVAELQNPADPAERKLMIDVAPDEIFILTSISVDLISKSFTTVRTRRQHTSIRLATDDFFTANDYSFYFRNSRVITTENSGQAVDLI